MLMCGILESHYFSRPALVRYCGLNSRSYLHFSTFSTYVLFLLQAPIQGTALHLVVMSLGLLWSVHWTGYQGFRDE